MNWMAAGVNIPTGHVEPTRADVPAKRGLWRSPRFLVGYEIVLVLVGYWLYSVVRNAVRAHETEAVQHAYQIVNIEKLFGLYHELSLNHFVAQHEWLAYLCNYYYATLHFVITITVGVWVYRRHRWYARRLRNTWYLMNCFALLGFAFSSLAPPRLLPGGQFVDTVVIYRTWGSWGDTGVAAHSNQYAAMPSMHIGWSLWVGITVYRLANRQWVRMLGVAYPVATLFVIVGTGNHYFLDAVGGAAVLGLAFFVQLLISHRPVFASLPPQALVAPFTHVPSLSEGPAPSITAPSITAPSNTAPSNTTSGNSASGDTASPGDGVARASDDPHSSVVASAGSASGGGVSARTTTGGSSRHEDPPGRATRGQRTSEEDLPVCCWH